jgi:ABC-type molybdate transport system substrate-binding protein
MKPFNPEEIKTFKAPKYGGVTLSLLSMFVLASMIVVWNKIGKQEQEQLNESFSVLCDESVLIPVKQCAEQFEREMNIKVSVHSKFVFDQNKSEEKASANANRYDLDISSEKTNGSRRALNQVPCAFRSIIFATRKNFSRNITSVEEVFQNKLAYSISHHSAKDGSLLQESIGETGIWQRIFSGRKRVYPSSNAAGLELSSANNLDGAFMWDSSAREFDLKIHHLNELKLASETICANTGDSSEKNLSALQFARFLAAPSKGQFHFAQSGFIGVKGDVWSDKPSLYLYCAESIKPLVVNQFEHFEKDYHVMVESHFLNQEKITLSLNLITQSKARKSLPDVVIGLSESNSAQIPDHYQAYFGNSVIKKKQFSFYLLKSTRFPESSMKLVDFLCKRENKLSKAD